MREFEEHLAQQEQDLNMKAVDLQKQREELERQQEQLNAQKMELQQVPSGILNILIGSSSFIPFLTLKLWLQKSFLNTENNTELTLHVCRVRPVFRL